MIRLLAGEKGQGKTKRLIDMANSSVKNAEGHIVYIDDDARHMFDLKHEVRFVVTRSFPLSNYRELVGFICGILSQDNDITEIYIDGLTNVVKKMDNEDFLKLLTKLNALSESNSVEFIVGINSKKEDLPEEAQALMV